MTRTIIISTKAEYDALVSEDKNFLLTNFPANVGDTVVLQYVEPAVDTPDAQPLELEHATNCTYVTKGHPIAKGWQALTLKRKGE